MPADPPPRINPDRSDAPRPERGPPEIARRKNVRQILNERYTDRLYTIQVHTGLEGDWNSALERHLADWPVPGLAPLVDSPVADALANPDDRDLMHPELALMNRTWADAYLYLGPVDQLTMSPFKSGEPPQPFRDSIRESRRFLRGN